MKKLLAVAVLCSSSAMIGLLAGGFVAYKATQVDTQKMYELMSTCQGQHDIDSAKRISLRSMFLEVLESDDPEVRKQLIGIIKTDLFSIAKDLKREIDEAPTKEVIEEKKKLLQSIEKQLNIHSG